MKTLFIGLRALVFMSGFILAATWLVMAIRVLDGYFARTPPEWLAYAAPLLVVPGAALVLASGGFFVVRGQRHARDFRSTAPVRVHWPVPLRAATRCTSARSSW